MNSSIEGRGPSGSNSCVTQPLHTYEFGFGCRAVHSPMWHSTFSGQCGPSLCKGEGVRELNVQC